MGRDDDEALFLKTCAMLLRPSVTSGGRHNIKALTLEIFNYNDEIHAIKIVMLCPR